MAFENIVHANFYQASTALVPAGALHASHIYTTVINVTFVMNP